MTPEGLVLSKPGLQNPPRSCIQNSSKAGTDTKIPGTHTTLKPGIQNSSRQNLQNIPKPSINKPPNHGTQINPETKGPPKPPKPKPEDHVLEMKEMGSQSIRTPHHREVSICDPEEQITRRGSIASRAHRYFWPRRPETPEEPSPPKTVCKEITFSEWLVWRLRRLFSITEKKDPELEDLELAPIRYRPIKLDQLCETTRFTREELQFMYRGFKQECPTGVISEETFREFYCKFFPIGNLTEDGTGRNSGMYAHYLFGTMDPEGNGHITFGDFIMGLSVILKGTLEERITWVFNLYDINNDGYVTKEELIDIVTSIYDLLGEESNPTIEDSTAIEHVETIFEKLDLNKDGVVTIDEFMEYCSKNENVVASLASFDAL